MGDRLNTDLQCNTCGAVFPLDAVHECARMTDLPDAETEQAAWDEWNRWGDSVTQTPMIREAHRAGFAAASGPWAEQLDTAKPRYDYEILGNHDADFLQLQADFDAQNDALAAALARNAELEAQLGPQSQTQSLTYRERLELMRVSLNEAKAERDALRAELDNLRETLAQKIEAIEIPALDARQGFHEGRNAAAARVRGSDDEAGEDA